MTPERLSRETDSAVEQLLLKRNGEKKTVQDVFEVVVAMNHDRRADALIMLGEMKDTRDLLRRHLTEDVRMTKPEFDQFIDGFMKMHQDRREEVAQLREEMDDIKSNCVEVHKREPRRKTDPETEDWGSSMFQEDQEIGDLRRAWRVLKWGVVVLVGTLMVVLGDEIAHTIFNLD